MALLFSSLFGSRSADNDAPLASTSQPMSAPPPPQYLPALREALAAAPVAAGRPSPALDIAAIRRGTGSRPWLALRDGKALLDAAYRPRRFGSQGAALAAGRAAGHSAPASAPAPAAASEIKAHRRGRGPRPWALFDHAGEAWLVDRLGRPRRFATKAAAMTAAGKEVPA